MTNKLLPVIDQDLLDECSIEVQLHIAELENICGKILEEKPVYIAYTNTDCNEGRGFEYPMCASFNKFATMRLSKGEYIQGSDCPVRTRTAYRILNESNNPEWFLPWKLEKPSKEDEAAFKAMVEKEEKIKQKEELYKRLLDQGVITPEELKLLKGQ